MVTWRDAVWQWAYQQQPTLDAITPEQSAGLMPEYITDPQARGIRVNRACSWRFCRVAYGWSNFLAIRVVLAKRVAAF
jgi:hypothetical protein